MTLLPVLWCTVTDNGDKGSCTKGLQKEYMSYWPVRYDAVRKSHKWIEVEGPVHIGCNLIAAAYLPVGCRLPASVLERILDYLLSFMIAE